MSGNSVLRAASAAAANSSNRIRLLASALSACGLLLTVPPLGSQSIHTQGLQQTTDVIRQTLQQDGLYTRTTTTTRNSYKSTTERKFSVTDANGCKLVVVSDAHIHTELPEKNRVTDRVWKDIYRPDFALMDPATVVVNDPEPPQPQWETKGYLVRISVEPGKPLMVASTVDPKANAARDLPGLPALAVYVSSRPSAERLAKAFTQLATACRANPSAK